MNEPWTERALSSIDRAQSHYDNMEPPEGRESYAKWQATHG